MTTTERRPIALDRVADLSPDVDSTYGQIGAKAYEYFVERGCVHGHDVDDWVRPEQELLVKPLAQLHREDSAFVVDIDLPDTDPADLHIRVTSLEMLVTSVSIERRQVFRIIRFPERINSVGARAEFFDNKLQVIAPVLSEEWSVEPAVRDQAAVA